MHENTNHLTSKMQVPLALFTTLGTLLVGMLSGLLAGSGRGYAGLALPPLTPPDAVFPIVWSVLYLLIGLSLFFIVRTYAFTPARISAKRQSIGLWIAQMVFNLCWSFVFFSFQLYAFAFVWLVALLAVTMALIINCFKLRPLAAWLLIPYEAWLLFAAYLNLYIAILN